MRYLTFSILCTDIVIALTVYILMHCGGIVKNSNNNSNSSSNVEAQVVFSVIVDGMSFLPIDCAD